MLVLQESISLKLFLITYLIVFTSCTEYTYELNTTIVDLFTSDGFYSEDPFQTIYDQNTRYAADYLLENNYGRNSPPALKYVENLNSVLEKFGNNKCLIVINNFLGVEIPSNIVPLILRRFGLAVVQPGEHSELYFANKVIYTPKEYLSKVTGNYTTKTALEITRECHVSEYFSPVYFYSTNGGYCIGLNPAKFSSFSKPWLCEVQVDLFMPRKLFLLGKHTQIFRCWDCDRYHIFSYMPKINILVDALKTLKEYDAVSVVNWMSRQRGILGDFILDRSDFEPATDFTIFGYVSCVAKSQHMIGNSVCQIARLSILFACNDCPNAYLEHEFRLGNFCLDFIKFLDEKYKQLLSTYHIASPEKSGNSLSGLISNFILNEQTEIESPLKYFYIIKSRYPDKIQQFAFAYASIFKCILGNVTLSPANILKGNDKLSYNRILAPVVSHNPFKEHIKIEFKFGQLHIVSCGSRGIESLSLFQIAWIFESRIWIFLLVFLVLIALCNKHVMRLPISSSLLSIFKVLIEQGDPFPTNIDKVNKMKLLICGILLTGLVISNAFKSENVYNIVTPRRQISYETMDELVEDKFKIFSRITVLEYTFDEQNDANDQFQRGQDIFISYKNWRIYGGTETASFYVMAETPLHLDKLEKCQMHPYINKTLEEPLNVLDPLVRSGIVDWKIPKEPDFYREISTIKWRFWNNQNGLIADDLHNCNKTAWMLPNYLAQEISRNLIKSGHHSDVGTFAFTSPVVYLRLFGLFPLSLLNQYSKISESGLVEWWPNFINRTDLSREDEKLPPKKPNMKGHAQVIFIFLGAGLSIGFCSLVGELCWVVLKYVKSLFLFCVSVIINYATKRHR